MMFTWTLFGRGDGGWQKIAQQRVWKGKSERARAKPRMMIIYKTTSTLNKEFYNQVWVVVPGQKESWQSVGGVLLSCDGTVYSGWG